MQEYARNNILYPLAGELAYMGYRRYVRPRLKKAWEYKATAAPLILSQKNNKMPTVTVKRPAKKTKSSKGLFTPPKKGGARRGTTALMEIKTPGGKKVYIAKNQAQKSSLSGGFLKARKYKVQRKHRLGIKGITHTHEFGFNQTTSQQTLYIGHSTAPVTQVWVDLFRLILKKLMTKTGVSIRDFTAIPQDVDFITTGDTFEIRCQRADGTLLAVNISHVYAAGQTWDTVVNSWATNFQSLNTDCILKYAQFYPTVNAMAGVQDRSPARIDLEFAYVDLYIKSTMKVQNRTVNTAGTDMEAVDNVPLYGKIYEGRGTGTGQIQPAPKTGGSGVGAQLIADNAHGSLAGSALDLGQQEPPQGWWFPGVKKVGKVHLDPGVIKTNRLIYRKSFSLNNLRQLLLMSEPQNQAEKIRTPFGKFAFMSFERMLQIGQLSATNITVGMEINHYWTMNMRCKYVDYAAPIFTTNNSPAA